MNDREWARALVLAVRQARRDTLEEAANVCDRMQRECNGDVRAAACCAEELRALAAL